MIYSVTEAAAPDIIMEFGFDKADDYEEVEKLVLDIYKDTRKTLDDLPSFYSLKTKEYPPTKEKKGYVKAMDKLEAKIKKSGPKFDLSTRAVYYINISKTTPRDLMNILGKVVASHGFKNMPSSGNGFKDFFKSFHMYKQVSDDVMVICDLSVLYTTQYSNPSYYDKLTFCFTAISTSDRNLKKLNLLKEGSELVFIDEGQQAEDYKARKAKEVEDTKKADDERTRRRFTAGISKYDDGTHPSSSHVFMTSDKEVHPDDADRFDRSRKIMNNEIKRRSNELSAAFQDDSKSVQKAANDLFRLDTNRYNMAATRDAANRHIRRHPDQYKESGIFSDVNLI